MKTVKRNDQGFVLVLTLLCALIISSVMLSTMFVSTKGQKLSKNFKESVQTLNAADGALKQARGAINAWLRTQQIGTGNVVTFTDIFTASNAAGKLVVPGNATDFGNLSMFGNTIKLSFSNNSSDAGGSTTDSDRVAVLQAEATSPSRQRVRVKAYIQAPSDANIQGVPTLQAGATFCNDVLGRKQKLRVMDASYYSAFNHPLPPFNCVGAACIDISGEAGSDPYNLPPGIMFNAAKQLVEISADSTAKGKPNTLVIASTSTNCDQLSAFASQISSLNDSLPNVNVLTNSTATSADLGTRTSPAIAIINGATSFSMLGGITRSLVTIDTNSKGSGIMLIQYDSETYTRYAAAAQKNFYYEGLVLVYGDEWGTFRLKGDDVVYGAVVMLSGSDDPTLLERFALRNASTVLYSKAAINQANLAIGAADATVPVTEVNDPRNETITIGWYEDYSF